MTIYVSYSKDPSGDCTPINWSVTKLKGIEYIALNIDVKLNEMTFGEEEADWCVNFSRKFDIQSEAEALAIIDNNAMPEEDVLTRYVCGNMCANTIMEIFTWYGDMQIELAEEYLEEHHAEH